MTGSLSGPHWALMYDLALGDSARAIDTTWAIGAVVIVSVLWWWPFTRRRTNVWVPRFASVAVLVLLAAVGARAWDQHRLLAALREGNTLQVEGPVRDFAREEQAWRRTGETTWRRRMVEAFTVGGVRFGYTRDAEAPGFRNLETPHWTPADGEVLRVHYVDDAGGDPMQRRILRLERRQP